MVTSYIVNFTDPEVTAFTINPFTTDGPVAPNTLELSSTAVRASSSLLLYGKGHPDYGERIQENLINLMENFSGATEPTFPVSGQTWFARITYAFIGLGSPDNAELFRWQDDSTLANGGEWVVIEFHVGVAGAQTTDQYVTGSMPTGLTSANDGSFWLDTDGSPLVPELYLYVNNSSSNLTPAFLRREMEDLTGLVGPGGTFSSQVPGSPALTNYLPQKQLKVYDGVEWKNSGNVYVNHVPPLSPSIGDLWYQTGVIGSPPIGSPDVVGGGVGSPDLGRSGPLSQLFIWARPGPGVAPQWLTTGYVDRSGDTMTGTLSFGLPVSSLFIWEGQGDDTAGADIRATANALFTAQENFYIHIDYDASDADAGGVVFEVASNSQTRTAGTYNSLFQVQSDGIIRSAMPFGSPGNPLGSPNTYKTLLLTADDNALINKAYVDDVIGTVGTLGARVTINENNIITLAGSPIDGSPNLNLTGKVSRTGDTMTGTLLFSFGSPQVGVIGVDVGDALISNLQTPVVDTDAATKGYVDNTIAALGSPGTDVYVTAASWEAGQNELTLTRTGKPVITVTIDNSNITTGVVHNVTTPFLRDTHQQESSFGSPVDFGSPLGALTLQITQADINALAVEDLAVRLATVELPYAREIITLGSPSLGSPNADTQFGFTDDNYVAGTNRLFVFVNGVKQYANERAHQHINFNTIALNELDGLNVGVFSSSSQTLITPTIGSPLGSPLLIPFGSPSGSPSGGPGSPLLGSPTGLIENHLPIFYTITIAVDGGSPAQTVTVAGSTLILFGGVVNAINKITGVTAVWNFANTAIDVYSNTTGTGSAIDIIDGDINDGGSPIGSPRSPLTILGALSNIIHPGLGSPDPQGSGSPIGNVTAYNIGDITPVAGGPISTISQNLAYFEVGSPLGSPIISTTDATFGQVSSTLIFNTPQSPGDVIELVYAPVSS